jgi:hypothetical protein
MMASTASTVSAASTYMNYSLAKQVACCSAVSSQVFYDGFNSIDGASCFNLFKVGQVAFCLAVSSQVFWDGFSTITLALMMPAALTFLSRWYVFQVFYDGFNSIDGASWTPKVGNGLDKGWDFWGFGLNEKQVREKHMQTWQLLSNTSLTQLSCSAELSCSASLEAVAGRIIMHVEHLLPCRQPSLHLTRCCCCCCCCLPCFQCFTPDATSVAVIPDPAAPNNTALRLQAVFYPTEITCMPDQAPFNSSKTSWTSGGIASKSKRIFKAPQVLAKNDPSEGAAGGWA